jgi:hypothetical protein
MRKATEQELQNLTNVRKEVIKSLNYNRRPCWFSQAARLHKEGMPLPKVYKKLKPKHFLSLIISLLVRRFSI